MPALVDNAERVNEGQLLNSLLNVVRETPERAAVISGETRVTFSQLWEAAERVAKRLKLHRRDSRDRVVVHVDRSAESLVLMLGTWIAGLTYVPVDVTWPSERVDFISLDSNSAFEISSKNLRVDRGPNCVVMDIDLKQGNRSSTVASPSASAEGRVSYVIYTSGSTGKPKGVLVEEYSVNNLLRAHWEVVYSKVFPKSAVVESTLFAPLTFDASIERVLNLWLGYSLHLINDETRRDPDLMCNYILQNKIAVLDTTPVLLDRMTSCELWSQVSAQIKLCIVGGEAISASLWQRLSILTPTFINAYGPTEATVNASVAVITGNTPNIGNALPGVKMRIVGADLSEVPTGSKGEILIGGAGLCVGYTDPSLDAGKFVHLERAGMERERYYRTGDLGSIDNAQTFFYHGRMDRQVKVSGYRVELSEIESVIASAFGIANVVAVVDGSPEQHRLLAFLERAEDSLPSRVEMFSTLKTHLPSYMLPAALIAVETFPVTPSGKTDEAALVHLAANYDRSPTGDIEQTVPSAVLEVWCEILSRGGVKENDNFFEIGGSSLLAIRAASRLTKVLGKRVPVGSILERPVFRDFLAYIESRA